MTKRIINPKIFFEIDSVKGIKIIENIKVINTPTKGIFALTKTSSLAFS